MKKHKQRKHTDSTEMTYNCSLCDYGSEDVASLWRHTLESHPGYKFDSETEKDMLFNIYMQSKMLI